MHNTISLYKQDVSLRSYCVSKHDFSRLWTFFFLTNPFILTIKQTHAKVKTKQWFLPNYAIMVILFFLSDYTLTLSKYFTR